MKKRFCFVSVFVIGFFSFANDMYLLGSEAKHDGADCLIYDDGKKLELELTDKNFPDLRILPFEPTAETIQILANEIPFNSRIIDFLVQFPNLKSLHLGCSNITDLSFLNKLPSLESCIMFSLDKNYDHDIPVDLSNLKKLVYFALYGDADYIIKPSLVFTKSISPTLKYLNLKYTKIANVSEFISILQKGDKNIHIDLDKDMKAQVGNKFTYMTQDDYVWIDKKYGMDRNQE